MTAIVPNPETIQARDGLRAKAGDVYDTSSFATLIRGNEAIISAFNPGWKNPTFMTTRFGVRHRSSPQGEPELEWSYLSPSAELTSEHRTGKFRLGTTSSW